MFGNTQMSDWSFGDYIKVANDEYLMKTNDYNEVVIQKILKFLM
jgi:hypothetical protein